MQDALSKHEQMDEQSLQLLLAQAASCCGSSSSSTDAATAAMASAMAQPQLLDNALINSSDFRMYCFKILPCTRRYGHDWTACPFAHPGEKATRRCPQRHPYVPLACPDMKKTGACPKREGCTYAHNIFEFWCHPLRFRTQLCSYGSDCKRPICFFAHNYNELRVVDQVLLQELEKQMDLLGEGAAFGFPPSNKKHTPRDHAAGGSHSPRDSPATPREGGGTPREGLFTPVEVGTPVRVEGARDPSAAAVAELTHRVSRLTEEVLAATACMRDDQRKSGESDSASATPPGTDLNSNTDMSPVTVSSQQRTDDGQLRTRMSSPPGNSAVSTPTNATRRPQSTSGTVCAAECSPTTSDMPPYTNATPEASGPAALQLLQLQLAAQKQRQASSQALHAMERQYSTVKLHAAAALLGIDAQYLAQALYSTPQPSGGNRSTPTGQSALLQSLMHMAGSPASGGSPAQGMGQEGASGTGPSLGGWIASQAAATNQDMAVPASLASMLPDGTRMSALTPSAVAAAAAGAMVRTQSGPIPHPELQAIMNSSVQQQQQQSHIHIRPHSSPSHVLQQAGHASGVQPEMPLTAALPSLNAGQDQMAATVNKLLADLARNKPGSGTGVQLSLDPAIWGQGGLDMSSAQQQTQQQVQLQRATMPVVTLMPTHNTPAQNTMGVMTTQQLPVVNAMPVTVSGLQVQSGHSVVEMNPQEWQQLLNQLNAQQVVVSQAPSQQTGQHMRVQEVMGNPPSSMHMPSMSTLANGSPSSIMVQAPPAASASEVDLTTSSPFAPSPAALAAAAAAVGFDGRSGGSGSNLAACLQAQHTAPLTMQARAQASALMGLMNKPRPGSMSTPTSNTQQGGVVLQLSSGGLSAGMHTGGQATSPTDVLSVHSTNRSGPTSGAGSYGGSEDGHLSGALTTMSPVAGSGSEESLPEFAGASRLMDQLSELIGDDDSISPALFESSGFKVSSPSPSLENALQRAGRRSLQLQQHEQPIWPHQL